MTVHDVFFSNTWTTINQIILLIQSCLTHYKLSKQQFLHSTHGYPLSFRNTCLTNLITQWLKGYQVHWRIWAVQIEREKRMKTGRNRKKVCTIITNGETEQKWRLKEIMQFSASEHCTPRDKPPASESVLRDTTQRWERSCL